MHLCSYFQTKHWALLQTFYQSNWIWMVNGRLQFQKYPTHQCTKMLRRENLCSFTRNVRSHKNSITWNLVFTLPLRMLLKPSTFSFKKDTITAKIISKLKCLEERKKLIFTLQKKDPVLHSFGTDQGHIFGSIVGYEIGVLLRRKGPNKPQFAYDIVRIHSLMIYTDLIEYNIVGDTKTPLLRCFFFISKLKSGDIITTGQYMNYQTFSHLQFRPLLKKSFQSIHIDLRDTGGEKIPFLTVSITRLVLMFRKASNIHF